MRELGFFATIFGRNRGIKQCLLDNVTQACVANTRAVTQLEAAVTERLANRKLTPQEIRRESYRIAHKKKDTGNPW